MSLPRQVLPGRFLMINRRCVQRELLLRPDEETNQTFLYCLALAAARYEIELILPSAMSNHHHGVLYDRHGREVEFREYFHGLIARAMNSLRGRCENFWSSDAPCVVELVDPADVMDKLVYAATNPVAGLLVERVHHWPGVNGLGALLAGRTLTVKRPRHFFRADGTLPEEVTLTLTIPPELGDAAVVRRELRARVAAVEEAMAAERRRTGARVLGRRGVLRQSWRSSPSRPAPRGGLRPRVAARSRWQRVAALQRNRDFIDAYRAARMLWRAGLPAVFPPGTYWLARFANITVAAVA
jgi:putative transposase